MSIFLGIDVGMVSVKIALVSVEGSRTLLEEATSASDLFQPLSDGESLNGDLAERLRVTRYRRIRGQPARATYDLLREILAVIPAADIAGVRACGTGGSLIARLLGVNCENEFRALARGAGALYPDARTVFEMGGQSSKFIALEADPHSGKVGIADYEKSGDCAAGTGSFLDQQATRLKFPIEDVGSVVAGAERSAKIAGRCSVFAKSDMIHAQQKGYTPPEVMSGLCDAVARNFKSAIMKGKKVRPPVLFTSGVAWNEGVVRAMRETFQMQDGDLRVPAYHAWLPAIGTALAEAEATRHTGCPDIDALARYAAEQSNAASASEPLSMADVLLLRDRVHQRPIRHADSPVDTWMGVDVGSVSTNVVVVDSHGTMIKEIYTATEGRPIEVVGRCFQEIHAELGDRIRIRGVGTTGSGRELIGELIGADTINDEITAHKTGAEFIARTMLDGQVPDTIFEIGGQDSKFISLDDGVVVDFAMNEACAAGTGSFLEERAEELGIAIKKEFAELALSATAPVRLGERCTVFMQQDVAACLQKGASVADITAGLAYSIVYNYLNRVVRGRRVGEVIFFQGGTAYNDAIAAAFARVLGKRIIVPPYNGVIGAVGAALLAGEKVRYTGKASTFRGWRLDQVDYTLREFICKACSNFCHMQEFTVEGEKTYWGDQCSDKFRRRQPNRQEPVIEDLLALRRSMLFDGYDPEAEGKAVIGLPRGMYIHENFPFWNTFFRELGYTVRLSDETNARVIRTGTEASVAEPCLPIQAYHGHVRQLLDDGVDYVFIPNMINAETPWPKVNSHYCPWGQTVPWVIRSSAAFAGDVDRLLTATLRFRFGPEVVANGLIETFRPLGNRPGAIRAAMTAAYARQAQFQRSLLEAGARALDTLLESGEIGIVLVGRAYNVNDRGMTLDIGNKLRDYYGMNVIPMDFLPVDSVDISHINYNMYWNYGRKILAAADIVGRYPNLHLIYLTNFKCGPDSYIKHYVGRASGKPYLTLQFDGHGNDAGYITRCEAYLDSKGALRWWAKPNTARTQEMEATPS